MHPYALRLHPGQDIKSELDAFVITNQMEAACILTCVGSLRKATLRFANQENGITMTGFFEIVSLTGVLSIHGSHYHISISDGQGQTFGAHLLEGSEIYTTAEIILLELPEFRFLRAFDDKTGYQELEIINII
jgi:predicted DNA-binding protein with PD1-like motif